MPLILTLYQVAWRSSPLRKFCGAKSKPRPQLVESSGSSVCSVVLNQLRQCASTAALPPPLSESPAGLEPQAKPAALSFAAPEPAGACVPVPQSILMVALFWKTVSSAQPFQATLEIGENSPKFGARNDVPHAPLMVRASIGAQLNAILGL